MKKMILTLFVIMSFSLQAENLSWTIPSGWVDLKQTSSMRLATLGVKDKKDLQIKITKFPGNVGGELANVNRWRRQMGLGPIAAGDLKKSLEEIDTKAGKAKLVNITNDGSQMLAVMIPHKGFTYFVKLMGKEADIKDQKKAMIELVKSMK